MLVDKFDPSFTRSRSSSGSSTTHPETGLHHQSAGESIQCLCFLDLAASLREAGPNQSNGQAAAGQTSSQAAISPPSSSLVAASGPNHKSLGSIDQQAGQQLALWLGTSHGCVLMLSLAMPDNEDNRVLQLQSINAEPIPQASAKLPGAILCLATFLCEPSRPLAPGAASTGGQSVSSQSSSLEAQDSQSAPSQATSDSSPNSSLELRATPFLAVVSEKQARVYQIPTTLSAGSGTATGSTSSSSGAAGSSAKEHLRGQETSLAESPLARLLVNKANLFAKCDLSDSSYACRSGVVQMRSPDESCLVSYLATGNMVVHPLPKLRPLLMDADFVPLTKTRLATSMCFSRNGHCLYQPSPSEICKFTISAQYKALLQEMTGSLYVAREMPEMPRGNFFKSLFSVSSSKQTDRDELFGESGAGKPSRGVATHIASSGLDKLKSAAAGTFGHDMRQAREGLDERGEKLGEIEDRTLHMLNQSESYAQAAHQLAQKFKDKKWYQF